MFILDMIGCYLKSFCNFCYQSRAEPGIAMKQLPQDTPSRGCQVPLIWVDMIIWKRKHPFDSVRVLNTHCGRGVSLILCLLAPSFTLI